VHVRSMMLVHALRKIDGLIDLFPGSFLVSLDGTDSTRLMRTLSRFYQRKGTLLIGHLAQLSNGRVNP
jgi:aryl carrier-like protein